MRPIQVRTGTNLIYTDRGDLVGTILLDDYRDEIVERFNNSGDQIQALEREEELTERLTLDKERLESRIYELEGQLDAIKAEQ